MHTEYLLTERKFYMNMDLTYRIMFIFLDFDEKFMCTCIVFYLLRVLSRLFLRDLFYMHLAQGKFKNFE